MRIVALSKGKFDKEVKGKGITAENVESFPNIYLISISHASVFDGNWDVNDEWIPMFRENKKNVLCLLFDDVVNDAMGRRPMTMEQAQEIVDFLKTIKDPDNSELIVHCAMGQSRSVAVAEFAAVMFGQDPDWVEARIDRSPNRYIRMMLNACPQ